MQQERGLGAHYSISGVSQHLISMIPSLLKYCKFHLVPTKWRDWIFIWSHWIFQKLPALGGVLNASTTRDHFTMFILSGCIPFSPAAVCCSPLCSLFKIWLKKVCSPRLLGLKSYSFLHLFVFSVVGPLELGCLDLSPGSAISYVQPHSTSVSPYLKWDWYVATS